MEGWKVFYWVCLKSVYVHLYIYVCVCERVGQRACVCVCVLPRYGVESPPEYGGPHVAARRGHGVHGGPVVGADVVHLYGRQVGRAVKAPHHIDMVIQQSHTCPWNTHTHTHTRARAPTPARTHAHGQTQSHMPFPLGMCSGVGRGGACQGGI